MNDEIFLFFYNFTHQYLFFDRGIIFFAQTFPYIIFLLSIIFLFYHHEILSYKRRFNNEAIWDSFRIFKQKWKEIVLVFFSSVFAWSIATVLKMIFHTPRPYLALENIVPLLDKIDFSFPSGHATFFMALGVSIFFSHKKVGYYFILSALLIGIARIIAGVHFPIDIVFGFILGATIAYLVKFFYFRIN